ncbi:MAG: hypothetical protein ABJ308_01040 [Halieaceae bacterium]
MLRKTMHLFWVSCLLLLPVAHSAAADQAYGYPLTDRFVATVVGTPKPLQAKLPEDIPFRSKRIKIFEDRVTPDVLAYNDEMMFSYALQKGAAPLMFLIAGTGASHEGGKNKYMARAFYAQGYHVISLSSPTWPNFVVSATESGVPGHVTRDAQDLYRAMQKTWNEVKGSRSATSHYLTGYSLGALNAAFVAQLDDQKQVFNFDKVLLINPPVSLYNSISLLDRMAENIPGGEDNFGIYFNNLVRVFTDVYKRQKDAVEFGDEFLVTVFKAMQPKDEELAALIGVAFRISSGSMVFTTDVMTDFGFVKPKGLVLGRYADLTPYRQVTARLGFTDFYHEFFYPFYKDEYPGMDRDAFIRNMSLHSIRDYLAGADKISVMHNADDVILEPGEIDFFTEVFADRAKIYPVGGHLGNMEYAENTAHMIGVFK